MKFLTLITALLLLAGCGSDLVEKDPTPVIERFGLEDSYGKSFEMKDQDLIKGINASIQNGRFVATWSVDRDAYYAALSLSYDAKASASMQFWDDFCAADKACGDTTQIECRFSMALYMSCGLTGEEFPDNPEVYVSDMISELPKRLYLVLETCTRDFEHCDLEYHLVELQ
ncbi:hypothetical protein [Hahella ganghwensis]|uniref:hypothetical protein n=1 Tax=Hahella ganghwensis TaxID=286420 RepID=UPI0004780236|nr:hypothetical protein [Hahella ganghwensis]